VPGGFALLKVHQGGYTVNFHKSGTAPARRRSRTSRGEYLGLYPACTLGTTADRNHVAGRDFSGLRRLPRSGL
jgi:Icc protein